MALTERERQMIEAYLPNPPDESLEWDEYYYLQATASGERVIKVRALQVFPYKDGTEYGIYQQRGEGLVRVDTGYGDAFRGAHMYELYDNKADCREQTHLMFDGWEQLRKRQREEGLLGDER